MSHPHDETVYFLPEAHFRARVEGRFDELRRELERMVPGADVQHVGSTAIPGSLTKGDLDIQVRVPASQYSEAKERLRDCYDVNTGGFTGEDAISFEDYSTDVPAGIHLTVIGGSADIQSRFRDRLMQSAQLRREYDELKRKFDGKSMAEYRDAKELFVLRVLDAGVKRSHFPERIGLLPRFEGPFDARQLAAEGCKVLFASYPAGTVIETHTHETENCGVITEGELILETAGKETRYGPGHWYHLAPGEEHAARFEVDTSEIEFWFDR